MNVDKHRKRQKRIKWKNLFILLFIFLMCAGIIGLLYTASQTKENASSIIVLSYHHIVNDEEKQSDRLKDNPWTVSTSEFEQQMNYLYDNGYHSITLNQLYNWYRDEVQLPNKSFVITFDDGYLSTLRYAVPILKKYHYSAANFVIGWKVRDKREEWNADKLQIMTAEDIKDKNNQGTMYFYSHTYGNHNIIDNLPALQVKSKDEILDDLKWSAKINSIDYLAYPFGASSENAIEAQKEAGVKMAFEFGTNRPVTKQDNIYLLPRYCIKSKMDIEDFKSIFPLEFTNSEKTDG